MPSKYCEKLPRCKNAWWCAIDYKPSKNVKCFDAMTNADRIRAMSDEELSEFIEYLTSGCDYMYPKCYASEFCTSGVCHRAWLDWLKAPADKEDE